MPDDTPHRRAPQGRRRAPEARPRRRGGPPQPRAAGAAPADLAALAARLTARDRRLCHLVWAHRVLTTHQCAELAFGSTVRAQLRLVALYRMGVLDRFRPLVAHGEGSAPWHYVLGRAGAAVLAAEQGITVAQLGYRHDRAMAIAHSQRLGHDVGVNTLFATLAGYARRHPPAALVTWLSERACADRWGQVIRPDGYGRWRDTTSTDVEFFLEYDTGTERLQQVTGKLVGYTDLAAASGRTTPVLYWVQSPQREASLRKAIGRPSVPVATATTNQHPAEAVWLPIGTRGPRRRLGAL